MPVERSVFQRVNNMANIQIGGNILFENANIEAKLNPIKGGQNVGWHTINTTINKGQFVGEVTNISTGWYKLELRAIVNGVQVGDIISVEKVGVGEVFIIAGQSNAQGGRPPEGGFIDKTYFGATDDRVNCIDFYDNNEISILPFPKISQLKAETNIAPHGKASWSWGILGDKIASALNCPVLFFNAAEGATRAEQWAQAAKGETVYNFYENRNAPAGWPYAFLRKSLNYYASIFGLRAVIWHQGEEDSFYNTSQNKYIEALETVISKSREHSGKNITWMLAKVSRNRISTNENIKTAQQSIIDKPNFNVFLGPETDDIQPNNTDRDDGVHFHGNGFVQLANAWADKIINERFLAESKPFLAKKLIGINVETCEVDHEITVSLPNNYIKPIWIWNGGNSKAEAYSKTIVAFDENYGLVRDQYDNFIFSPPFSYSPPSLGIDFGNPKICFGDKLKITANTFNNNYLWNTGENTKEIFIDKAGENTIKLSSTNIYGCRASKEATLNLQILPLPKAPVIEAITATTVCEGEFAELKGKENDNFIKIWSNAAEENTVKIAKSGNYFLQNIDSNGCKSASSNNITITVNSIPNKPTISAEDNNQFCKGDSLMLKTNISTEYFWYNNSIEYKTKQPILYINKPGKYSVKLKNDFNCFSALADAVSIDENNLPDTPIITAEGATNLCAGDATKISTNASAEKYNWFSASNNIEASITNSINITSNSAQASTEKFYFLKITDKNNCSSLPSNLVKIIVKAKPETPIINQIGAFSISNKGSNFSKINFVWWQNNQKLNFNSPEIKVSTSGEYRLSILELHKIDNQTLSCNSEISNAINYLVPEFNIIAYPNPVKGGYLYIETKDNVIANSIRIITLAGQEVFKLYNIDTSNRLLINVVELKGLYILELNIGGTIMNRNLFIEN